MFFCIQLQCSFFLKEKPGKGKAPYLSLSTRMTLAEQRLTDLEQENEWWTDWKSNRIISINLRGCIVETRDISNQKT